MMKSGTDKMNWTSQIGIQVHPERTICKQDVRNAYLTISRSKFFTAIVAKDPASAPHAAAELSNTHVYYSVQSHGVEHFMTSDGVSQGGQRSSLYYCLAYNDALNKQQDMMVSGYRNIP